LAVAPNPLSDSNFAGMMQSLGIDASDKLAVAVSGGGDSMALTALLQPWCTSRNCVLTALTVDHGLRCESQDEANFVHNLIQGNGITHCILKWEGDKPTARIQEEARAARYTLMGDYCAENNISYLLTAHHGDDQIETVLFRLCKGSGLDGLVGMRPVQNFTQTVTLLRPLLSVSHEDLIATCKQRGWPWVEDPSNINDHYARVRLRGILDVIKGEGLSPARMMMVSKKLQRAVKTFEQLTDNYYKTMVVTNENGISINHRQLCEMPDEIGLRLLTRIITEISAKENYPARGEDIERLWSRITTDTDFKGATLGLCKFKVAKGMLLVKPEKTV